ITAEWRKPGPGNQGRPLAWARRPRSEHLLPEPYRGWPGLQFASGHGGGARSPTSRSEEHTSELQSLTNIVCRLLLEKKKQPHIHDTSTIRNNPHDPTSAFHRHETVAHSDTYAPNRTPDRSLATTQHTVEHREPASFL